MNTILNPDLSEKQIYSKVPATSVMCYENVEAAVCSQHKHLLISKFGVYV